MSEKFKQFKQENAPSSEKKDEGRKLFEELDEQSDADLDRITSKFKEKKD
jgi:hypothetical protein